MITIQLQGGLGNQLFQYAAARALAHRHGTSVAFDLRFFQNQKEKPDITPRGYELGAFGIVPTPPPLPDRLALGLSPLPFQKVLRKLVRRWHPVTEYREPSFRYDPVLLEATSARTYLTGYFQSERYFSDMEGLLRNELKFVGQLETEVAPSIQTTRSVSLHIRRGDYVTNPAAHRFHGTCSLDYYRESVAYLTERLGELHVFVFSDDQAWARQHLTLAQPTTFVEGHTGLLSYKDMQLMSQCRHHILANSSFSWWGAWLNPSPHKIVVAPKRWFADKAAERQTQDLIPTRWIRI
jgi:hypothetical protein